MKVAYQGIEGSYSHEAARNYFGGDTDFVPQESFRDVFGAVLSSASEAGIVPVENSITGSVVQNYDLMSASDCCICGETILPVEHVLLGMQGAAVENVKQIYSHEQGFLQCAGFLSSHPDWLQIPYFNTAVAAKYVADTQDKSKAAIASAYAGRLYGLATLAQNISDRAQNFTRFAVICANGQAFEPAFNKATILFTLRHQQGSLAAALNHLSCLNLTRIESRPTEVNWEYRFYVDLEGDLSGFQNVLQGMSAYCTSVRLLGMYKSAK